MIQMEREVIQMEREVIQMEREMIQVKREMIGKSNGSLVLMNSIISVVKKWRSRSYFWPTNTPGIPSTVSDLPLFDHSFVGLTFCQS